RSLPQSAFSSEARLETHQYHRLVYARCSIRHRRGSIPGLLRWKHLGLFPLLKTCCLSPTLSLQAISSARISFSILLLFFLRRHSLAQLFLQKLILARQWNPPESDRRYGWSSVLFAHYLE